MICWNKKWNSLLILLNRGNEIKFISWWCAMKSKTMIRLKFQRWKKYIYFWFKFFKPLHRETKLVSSKHVFKVIWILLISYFAYVSCCDVIKMPVILFENQFFFQLLFIAKKIKNFHFVAFFFLFLKIVQVMFRCS